MKKRKTSRKQKIAARKNIKKAQRKWKSMTHRQHALSQPQGRARRKPGTTGKGKYFRIVVRPKSEFAAFRIQDVGRKGHIKRLAGRRKEGSWATHPWLISKKEASIRGGKLVGKTSNVKKLLTNLGTKPKRTKKDVLKAKPRRNIPERAKPTRAMREAQKRNIKKAQAARWKRRR